MSTEQVTIERILTPDMELAVVAQEIGFSAWKDQFEATRTEDEVRHTFDPDSTSGNADKLLTRMNEKDGLFVGVIASIGDTAIGYAWASDDVSGSPASRLAKRMLGRRPYAWLAQINVLPEHQEKGVGSNLFRAALEPFKNDQIPTTYVFEENPRTIEWFTKRGMSVEGDPVEKTIYFGDGTPVQQLRMVGPDTLRVRNITGQIGNGNSQRIKVIDRK